MKPNLIWIITFFLWMSAISWSCGKARIEYRTRGDFNYVNGTVHKVTIDINGSLDGARFKHYTVLPNDTLKLSTDGESSEPTTTPRGYMPAISGDTTCLRFNDSLCYCEYFKSGRVLHNIDSYDYTRISDRHYSFYFIINNSLLDSAIICD